MRWREVVQAWGSSAEERAAAFPCDALIPDHSDACWRAVAVRAEPARVFRWLCQLRVAPYSYDWIDNLGRRSPRELTPGLDALAVGQPVMRIFDLASFEPGRHLTLRLRRPGVFPPLAVSYVVVPTRPGECRIAVKLVMRLGGGLRDRFVRAWGPTLDWIMMRRQLLNLRMLAERTLVHSGRAGGAPPVR